MRLGDRLQEGIMLLIYLQLSSRHINPENQQEGGDENQKQNKDKKKKLEIVNIALPLSHSCLDYSTFCRSKTQ